MTRDMVKKSVEAHWGIQKFLDYFECNCFTAPCPDLCATRRLNEKQFTMCLNHSLNNEQGIPSACEYDLGALISKLMLQAIGRRPSYMGNCFTSPIRARNCWNSYASTISSRVRSWPVACSTTGAATARTSCR